MMHPAFFQSRAARLPAERPLLTLERARAIASAVGDTPLQVEDEILMRVGGHVMKPLERGGSNAEED